MRLLRSLRLRVDRLEMPMKLIGLIGGMSWESSVAYYRIDTRYQSQSMSLPISDRGH